jgi:hypothetical protein
MDTLAQDFSKEGFMEIHDFGPLALRTAITTEVDALLGGKVLRRNVTVACTENTPRVQDTVSRSTIFENGELIPTLYKDPDLLRFIARMTRSPEIIPVPFEPEQILITRMLEPGDTHGWHWDDYSYVMVWMIEATKEEEGGVFEFVPDTTWNKESPQIERIVSTRPVTRCSPPTGSVYFLKADTALHRVTPLTRDGITRIVLVYSYATLEDLKRPVTHQSMAEIYPDECADVEISNSALTAS